MSLNVSAESIFLYKLFHGIFSLCFCASCPHFSQPEAPEIKNCVSRSILHTAFMICFPRSAPLSAECFRSMFNLIKKTSQSDSDLASIFWPSVMIQALALILLHFVVRFYNRGNCVLVKNLASHTRECVLRAFCDRLK